MIRRSALLAIAFVLAACGSSSALKVSTGGSTTPGGSDAPGAAACGPRTAHTLAADKVARVYAAHGAVFACSGTTGKITKLGRSGISCLGGGRVGPVALAGPTAAYAVEICGVDTGTCSVFVRRLTDGSVLSNHEAVARFLGPESHAMVGSIVVRKTGHVAWIGVGSSIVHQGNTIEVHAVDRSGNRTLDSGGAIAPGSLRLNGSLLTWTDGGKARSARLS